MKKRRLTCLLTGIIVLAMGPARAVQASPMITYDFSGTLTTVDNSTGRFGSTIQDGSPFTLEVTLPADTPNSLAGNTSYGHYAFSGPGMSMTINGQPYPLGPVAPGVVGEVAAIPGSGLFYGTQAFLAPSDPSIYDVRLDFSLGSGTGALSSDALPTSLNIADFKSVTPLADLFVFTKDNHAYSVLGRITSATVTGPGSDPSGNASGSGSDSQQSGTGTGTGPGQAVPEPGTFLVVALGAVGFLISRKRGGFGALDEAAATDQG